MADILIRGLDMPTDVYDCPLNTFGYCNLAQDSDHAFCIGDSRPEWCPLVPLPEGHGDLIDKQAFMADIAGFIECLSNVGVLADGEMLWGKLMDALANAETIVPAEGGTDNA